MRSETSNHAKHSDFESSPFDSSLSRLCRQRQLKHGIFIAGKRNINGGAACQNDCYQGAWFVGVNSGADRDKQALLSCLHFSCLISFGKENNSFPPKPIDVYWRS